MKIRSRSVTERDRRVRARLTSQVSILSSPFGVVAEAPTCPVGASPRAQGSAFPLARAAGV